MRRKGEALPLPGERGRSCHVTLWRAPVPVLATEALPPAQLLPAASTGARPPRGAPWGCPEERQVRPSCALRRDRPAGEEGVFSEKKP